MKILWALEPRSQSSGTILGMDKLLKQFSPKESKRNVGYLVTENEHYLYRAFDIPADERFTSYPKELICEDLLKAGVNIKRNAVHIINHRTFTTTAAVDRFLKFAKAEGTDLIALFTHNKKGLERFFMGSFAETAIHRSRIDILVASPKTKFPSDIRNVLYASDFSRDAKKDLRRILTICKRMGAQLTVFHAAQIIYRWSLDESNPEVHAYRRATKKMEHWILGECKKVGVPVSVVVKAEFESVTELALKEARTSKADLLVVSSKAGPLAALMGGSTARNLVRNGVYPVLVLKT